MDWREEFFEFENVTYLNAAGQSPMPRAAARALEAATEWNKLPHQLSDQLYFELPDRVRALVARLIGGQPEEVAITTGATCGLAAVAMGIDWKPEDEVLIAGNEFPAHGAVFMPLAEAGRLRVHTIVPAGRFLTTDDFLARLSPRTRLVSTSLVRFDDAVRIDAARLAEACHAIDAYLLLDVSQSAGAMLTDARALGADFLACAGYKWLLSPYGTGFFWVRGELIERLGVGPFYWMALEGAAEFHSLGIASWSPTRHARRWDSPETASFFNLAAMEASLEFLLRVGVETIWQHNALLIQQMVEALPRDRCVLASPADPAVRGPYACVAGRSPERTRALYEKLRAANLIVSLRGNALRVAPHLYNTPRDIGRLITVLGV